ncbi:MULTISPECIES: OmpP1/FadL family transporter [Methylophaga]|uniref:Outer membrane protein transport protein n=1 Tax=Methylophaga marina TaxID=45495 RepID=A0ABN0TE93_9GAMM|nr:outer membrane protein transport protein [Methylophaga marina]BDZ72642.1 aromatic hydrocarbon degradation protein [Methylophaga marina]
MKLNILKAPSFLLLSTMSSASFGAGFAIIEQSVTGLGRAFAGSAAAAEDGSTVFFNPAGLVYLKQAEMDFALNYIAPNTEFNNDGTSSPANGGDYGDAGNNAVVPNFYFAKPLNDKVAIGFGVTAPFGLVTEYNENWVGRYFAVKSDLKTINFNPSIAFKATDKLSIGFGVSAEYIDLTLSQMTDRFGAPDRKVKLEADDWGYGYNLGIMYQMTPETRLALAYRSKISHTLKGEGKVTIPTGEIEQNIQGDVDLPETLSLAIHHQLNDKWSVMADATMTRWSRFEELAIESDGGAFTDTKAEDWDNSMRYGIGLNYQYSDKWQFRTGIAYDETPVPNAERRTARIPDNDRKWLAIGATYNYSDNLVIDAGYAHLFASNPSIRESDGSHSLNGDYDVSVDLLGVQLRWLM